MLTSKIENVSSYLVVYHSVNVCILDYRHRENYVACHGFRGFAVSIACLRHDGIQFQDIDIAITITLDVAVWNLLCTFHIALLCNTIAETKLISSYVHWSCHRKLFGMHKQTSSIFVITIIIYIRKLRKYLELFYENKEDKKNLGNFTAEFFLRIAKVFAFCSRLWNVLRLKKFHLHHIIHGFLFH